MMRFPDSEVLAAPSVRRSLTTPGDIRSDIAFQNDINALLARIDEAAIPFRALATVTSYGVSRIAGAGAANAQRDRATRARQDLHVVRGGRAADTTPRSGGAAVAPPAAQALPAPWPAIRVRHGA